MSAKKYTLSDLYNAFEYSLGNKRQCLDSNYCGCFNCLSLFFTYEVQEWEEPLVGQKDYSAICPFCHKRAVIAEQSGQGVCAEYLRAVHKYWLKDLQYL